MLNRRKFLAHTAATVGALSMPTYLRAQSGPIRIGLITTITGPGQLYGSYIRDGAELAVAEINAAGGVNGQQVELVVRDSKSSPDGALAAYRELIGDGIRLFAQGTFTANLLATLPLLEENDAMMMVVGASSLAITHENYTPNMFRLGFSAPMCFGGYGHLMAERFPEIESWTLVRSDVNALADITDAFADGLRTQAEADGRSVSIDDPILVPYNAPDFRNQISRVLSAGNDGLFNCVQGADSISYYQQARSFQLDKAAKLICESASELSIAKAMGEKTLPSIWSWTGWYPHADQDNAQSMALLEAYKTLRNDPYPNWYVGVAHDCIMTLANAIGGTGSTAPAELIPYTEGASFNGALGEIRFRPEDHAFAGKLTFINFGASETAPEGWEVFESVQVDGAQYLEPPTPGRALE